MSAAKTTHKVGDLLSLDSEGEVKVTRPDGVEVTVTGGLYVLTQSGKYDVGGKTLEAK